MKERDYESPSSLEMWEKCTLQHWFRYHEGFKTPPAVSMIRGSSGHEGQEFNYVQKIDSHEDAPLADVLDATSDSFERNSETVENWEGLIKPKVKDGLLDLMKLVHKKHFPTVQPVEVEKSFTIEMPNPLSDHVIKIMGIPDVIALFGDNLSIRDSKFTTKAKSQSDVDGSLAGTIYAYAKKINTFTLDAMIRTKAGNNNIDSKTAPRTEHDFRKLELRIPQMIRAIRSGNVYPCAPTEWWCSKERCGFWNICEQGDKNKGAVHFDLKPSQSIL